MHSHASRTAVVALLVAVAVPCRGEGPPVAGATGVPAPRRAIELVDARGRTVQFASAPQRIAVAGRGVGLLADLLYLFPQARERVVAIPEPSQPRAADFLALLDPGLSSKKVLGGGSSAGVEQLAPFHPDVVVLKSVAAERLGEPLERVGLPVVFLEGESPERFLDDVAVLGRLFDDTPRAERIVAYFRERLAHVRERLRDLPATGRPRVLLLTASSRGGEGTFSQPPGAWIQTRMIVEAGGVPAAGAESPGGTVTAEQVAALAADRIVVASYRGDSREVVAQLRADPLWAAMPAVRAGRLGAFPGDFSSWDQPGPRWILGQLWLARTLHPERFADLDLRVELAAFYATLYGLPETAVRDHVVPVLTGDLAR